MNNAWVQKPSVCISIRAPSFIITGALRAPAGSRGCRVGAVTAALPVTGSGQSAVGSVVLVGPSGATYPGPSPLASAALCVAPREFPPTCPECVKSSETHCATGLER